MTRKLLWLILIFLTACSAAGTEEINRIPLPAITAVSTPSAKANTAPDPTPDIMKQNRRVAVEGTFSPNYSLGFDSIRPIYEPEFAPAEDVPIDDQELVLGISWDGEAKAYPIGVLRFREMVDDELAGIPTLVTW